MIDNTPHAIIYSIIAKAVGKIHKVNGVELSFENMESEKEAITEATDEIIEKFSVDKNI